MIKHMKRYDSAYSSNHPAASKLADHFYERARSVASSDAVGRGATATEKSIKRHARKNEEVDEDKFYYNTSRENKAEAKGRYYASKGNKSAAKKQENQWRKFGKRALQSLQASEEVDESSYDANTATSAAKKGLSVEEYNKQKQEKLKKALANIKSKSNKSEEVNPVSSKGKKFVYKDLNVDDDFETKRKAVKKVLDK